VGGIYVAGLGCFDESRECSLCVTVRWMLISGDGMGWDGDFPHLEQT